jgi:tetratricopeptide (TPR) repeat protein
MPHCGPEFALAAGYALAGQLDQAEQVCHALLERRPTHADALHLLGVIALRRGDPDRASAYIERAIAENRNDPAYWDNLGVAHTTRRNYPAATAAYEQSLRLRPDNANTYSNLGVALLHQGKAERAVAACRRAVTLNPRSAVGYNNLGLALRLGGQLADAVAAHRQAIRLWPGYAEAFNNLGIVLQLQGELHPAIEAYRQAVQLVPTYAEASNNLATALKELGKLDEAVAQYQATLRISPGHALTCYNLSQFAAEGRYRFSPEELRYIEERLASDRVAALDRGLLSFTLANVLDYQGAFDQAFHYYRQANELMRQAIQRDGANRYDAGYRHALVDRLIALFDQAFFERAPGWGSATELPVFLVGMPRSGSTLIEQVLASHPRVFGAGELDELARRVAAVDGATSEQGPYAADLSFLTEATARSLSRGYLGELACRGPGAERVIDKTLGNFIHLGLIAAVFPRVRIVHCVRDPLDVCLSCYFQNFESVDFSHSLEDIGSYYREYDRLMTHWRQVLPVPMLDVRYEDLIANQEGETRRLLDFCKLEWDDRCLAFHANRRAVRTASTLQVRKPISRGSVGRWKRYRSHLGPLFKALQLPDERQ